EERARHRRREEWRCRGNRDRAGRQRERGDEQWMIGRAGNVTAGEEHRTAANGEHRECDGDMAIRELGPPAATERGPGRGDEQEPGEIECPAPDRPYRRGDEKCNAAVREAQREGMCVYERVDSRSSHRPSLRSRPDCSPVRGPRALGNGDERKLPFPT